MANAKTRSDVDKTESEHELPGGKPVNRAATVATSAALGGAAAGALAGTVAGPVGVAVGAAVGAVAAGFVGNSIAESVDVETEEAYWRDNFKDRPYVEDGANFEDYGPAYRHGIDGFVAHDGRTFDDAEGDLSRDWTASRGASSLGWERARLASRDAWQRLGDTIERAVPGDSDRDGK
jgi:hypothetical protein